MYIYIYIYAYMQVDMYKTYLNIVMLFTIYERFGLILQLQQITFLDRPTLLL